MRSTLLRVLPALLVSLVQLDAGAAPASPLSIGEVSTEGVRNDSVLEAELRRILEQELVAVELGKPLPRPTVLSVALVQIQMDRVALSGSKAQVSVVLNATLRDKKKGAVVAIVEGRARAENEERLVDLLEHAAMKSAARSALSRVPQALDVQR
jgi:hypothetical protein